MDIKLPNWKQFMELAMQPKPQVRGGVHVLLVLGLAYSTAQLTWRVLPAPEEAVLAPIATQSQQAGMAVSNIGQRIPQWHLFGEVGSEAEVEAAPVDLPETNLKLTLRGLIASSDPSEARAIVADPSGKENFYKIGDKLPGNAELKEIHADRIVIRRGARFETLKLPKEILDSMPAPVTRGSRSSPRPEPNNGAGGDASYSLGQYRDALLNNPQQVADLVRIQPTRISGKFVGYRLQPGRDAKFLSRYGLMPGDLVTSVNGVALDNPSKGLTLLKDLSTVDTLNLEIERNGVRQRFTLPVN